jgi:indole-3-glycerol phosphate synthase
MNFLSAILDHTRGEVARRKSRAPESVLRGKPLYLRDPLSLSAALRKRSPAVIAEIKKASPSKGVICPDFDPAGIARQYEAGGACAISVLTEERFFLGSLGDLESARHATALPILRKDFILDPYQIHEAKSAGADAVLLIAAALGPGELAPLMEETRSLGMEALVEIHSPGELESLRGLDIPLIGINNRDLVTFETDISLSAFLAPKLPPRSLGVSESGIRTGADIVRLSRAGIHAFLIGEQFMRSGDPGTALADILKDAGESPEGKSSAGELLAGESSAGEVLE